MSAQKHLWSSEDVAVCGSSKSVVRTALYIWMPLAVGLLSACGPLSPDYPVIPTPYFWNQTSGTKFDTVAITADRRTVNLLTQNGSVKVCAEPPPDVALEVSKKLDAALQASLARPEIATISGDAQLKTEYATLAKVLMNRTELVDAYRTLSWDYCLAYMNGAITGPEWSEKLDSLQKMISDKLTTVSP